MVSCDSHVIVMWCSCDVFLYTGIIPWGPQVQEILDLGKRAVQQTIDSVGTLVSVLLRGTEKLLNTLQHSSVVLAFSCILVRHVSFQVMLVVARLLWLHT